MNRVNADHNRIALTVLNKLQHQSWQPFAQWDVFGTRPNTQLVACHVEGNFQFGEVFIIEDFSRRACSNLIRRNH